MVSSTSIKDSESLQATNQAQAAKRIAVVFPGQGSQSVGMLTQLSQQYPHVKQTFDEASRALDFDLWDICQSEDKLSLTEFTQPALLTASMAIWRILQDEIFQNDRFKHESQTSSQDNENADTQQSDLQGTMVRPHIVLMAGHSLGEYSALCATNSISLKDAVRVVHQRGKLMQQAVEGLEIQMAALLGLEHSQVISICEQVMDTTDGAIVSAANFNSPTQVVIAGNFIGVERVAQQVKMLGKKSIPLRVSVPAHCQLMRPACEQLSNILKKTNFDMPTTPVIQNLHARVEPSVEDIKKSLTKQLCLPVLWSQTMQMLANRHVNMIIECGAGTVLSNLAKRQSTPIISYPTDKPSRLNKLIEALL